MAMSASQSSRRALLSLSLGASAGLLAVACSDDTTDGSGGAGGGSAEDISDVIFEGGASDEALLALLAQAAETDAAEGASFIAPEDDAALAAATAATFEWAVGSTARSAPAPSRERRPRQEGLLERAIGALLGVREAHAHGTPVNGRAYFLVFATASSPKLLRVFTTNLSYTPAAAAWQKLVDAGEAITISITNAIFEENRVAQDGGPFTGSDLHVTVA